jgi:integrase
MLRKVLSVAVDWELLSHVPKVRWFKGPQPEFDFLTFDEAERFLEAADPEWRPMFTLALRTGLRIGELWALRWDISTSSPAASWFGVATGAGIWGPRRAAAPIR